MAYVESTFPVQLFPESFESIVSAHGWEMFFKYCIVAPATSTRTKKFARVYLFRSKGTDNQIRHFGIVHTYGGKIPTPIGQEPIVTHTTLMGQLIQDTIDNTIFYFKVAPVTGNYLRVYINDNEVTTGFILSSDKTYIKFDTAPNGTVTATYGVSDDAPEKPSKIYIFTFEDVIFERLVLDYKLVKDESGVYSFDDTVNKIKEGTLTLKDSVGEIDPSLYSVDLDNPGVVTFNGYSPTGDVYASFINLLAINEPNKMTELYVTDMDVQSGKSVMENVYSVFRYVNPSPPTTLTFIDQYTDAWSMESEMFYWGNITKDRMVLFFRIEPSPDPEKAYYVPLYIGRMSTSGNSAKLNNVIIGGSNSVDMVPSTTVLTVNGKNINYGPQATNGNEGVQLQQSIGGSYYQRYYLAFITHDKMADVSPESRFNPSVYSGKYHISLVYVVHPNDGFVGLLDEVYAVHPKNISQLDELEVREFVENEIIGEGDGVTKVFHLRHTPSHQSDAVLIIKVDCVEQVKGTDYTIIEGEGINTTDEQLKTITFTTPPAKGAMIYATYDYDQTYKFTLATTPISPFTLENITPYAPIGLGILKKNEPFIE